MVHQSCRTRPSFRRAGRLAQGVTLARLVHQLLRGSLRGKKAHVEQDKAEAEPMGDVGYLRALVGHTVPLASVPDGETAKAIRKAAGVSRQVAGVVLGCGANTLLRYEASQVRHSRLLKGSRDYRALLAALMTYIARTDPDRATAIRRAWKPIEQNTNSKENAA
jgi:hypothetical protein